MVTKARFWWLLVAVSFLVLFILSPAVCQDQPSKADSDHRPSLEPEEATHFDYSKSHAFPDIFAPYTIPFVPKPRLDNSQRLQNLVADGKLPLTLDDAIALALENNLDIAVARYDLPIAQTDLLRTRAGGAARGVSGVFESAAIFGGAIGGGIGSGGGVGGGGAGGTLGGGVNSVGSQGCCDPRVYVAYGWNNALTPLYSTVVSGVPVESSHSEYLSTGYSQGFLTGTTLAVSASSDRYSANVTTALFNPSFVSSLSVGFAQHLLNGFGTRTNSSFMRISRNNLGYSMSVFRDYTITTVAAIMTTYFDLLADQENIRVAREGLRYAQKLLEDNQAEAQIGAVAQYDVVRSQEEVALRQQDLLVAQNLFSQDAQSLKAKISKSFSAELAMVEILPTDHLPEPHPEDVPPLAEALRQAESRRPKIEQAELNLRNQEIAIRITRNRLLPSLDAYASYNLSGEGAALSPTLGNILGNDYPSLSYGISLSLPIRNRLNQADAARAVLEHRQLQMKLQNEKNQGVWDVSKAVSAVQQAKLQLDAALNLASLSRRVLDMQQQKFKLAAATVEDVITAQGNLSTAEGNVVKARASYAKALVQYEQATGTLLERNDIDLSEAVQGEVHRAPNIPGTREPVN